MSRKSRKARRRGLRKGWMAIHPPSPGDGAPAGGETDAGDGGNDGGDRTEGEASAMIEEACLPWTPLPEPFSHDWAVDVVHLAEDYGVERRPFENLSIAVAAYSEPSATTPRQDAAWRIDFRRCEAYRKRIIQYAGSRPLTRPDRWTGTAFWEIAPSRYLVESGVRGAYSGEEFHHFVIVAAITTVYEILAQDWRCAPLPEEWAKPFSGGPFPHW